jgi:hypothetical protein
MAGTAPISQRPCKAEKNQIAPGNERRWQTGLGNRNGRVAGERSLRNRSERIELDQMIVAQTGFPGRVLSRHALTQPRPHTELYGVSLAIVEADRLDTRETLERPGNANRRILAA